ncbi:MAG: C39 family peptidase [Syntrophothermus sp.]
MRAKLILLILITAGTLYSQPYPDQHIFAEKEGLIKKISSLSGMQVSSDGKSVVLSDGATSGYAIFEPDSSVSPFNRGLPSWNGYAPNTGSSFKVQIRFYYGGWSGWFTCGYWKENIWPDYGAVKDYYGNKIIDVDYVTLASYCSKWQFQVIMSRTSAALPTPSLSKLSLFVSDQVTTDKVNITDIVNDNPAPIFIDTEHFYQYALDPGIGGDICSPTSTSMAIRSYNIKVDPLQFAKDNYDNFWGMFGVWPKAVQNASQYGLNGAVTRYRTWSDARKVLAAGGRIVMSVGKPLYTGHLIMLAGFDASGIPIVHDPAIRNGYSYKFDKTALSQSWFSKGGVSYTFFLDKNTTDVSSETGTKEISYALTNFPNPFNGQTLVRFENPQTAYTRISVYDITGREVGRIKDEMLNAGTWSFSWNASGLPSGNYFIHVSSGSFQKTIKTLLLK